MILKPEQFNINSVNICDNVKNKIIYDAYFNRILYSTPNITINGVYIYVKLTNYACEKYYSKYKCIFDISQHKQLLYQIKNIEEQILLKYIIPNKYPQFKIDAYLKTGNIKIFEETNNDENNYISDNKLDAFMLKISGIWETQFNYGIIYKFVKINNCVA